MPETDNFGLNTARDESRFEHIRVGLGYMDYSNGSAGNYDLRLRAKRHAIHFTTIDGPLEAAWVLD